MNLRMVTYLLGAILATEAGLLLLPLLVSAIYGESILPFLFTILALLAFAVPAILMRPRENTRFYAKEGFVTVALGWIFLSLFGSLPFLFSGAIPNFFDAFFETVSGFTTTGATVLPAVEHLPRGILFWRSFTHWVGGMGVLVFVLAILPSAGGQSIHLMRAEVPGPTKGKLVPKMQRTSLILYGIYTAMTLILIVILLLTGMPLYDSLVNAFGVAGTGGFSVLNNSIAGYANPAAEWVMAIFMFLFGINFNLYYFLLLGNVRDVLKSEELRAYSIWILLSTGAIAVNTARLFDSFGETVRAAFFQVTSLSSTSGFSTVNFDTWPTFSKTLLVIIMMFGACAGSTAGGLKISRVLILLKRIPLELRRMVRPNSVNVMRHEGKPLADETVRAAGGYLIVYIFIMLLTTLLIAVDDFDLTTNLTASVTCLNNVGPGLGAVGPLGNFSGYSSFSTLLLTFNMLLGRLELMPILILFSPRTWRKR